MRSMLKTKFMEGFCLTLSRIFRNLPPQTLSGIFLSQKTPFEWNLCCQLGIHRWTLMQEPSRNLPTFPKLTKLPEPWWQWNARRTCTWNTSARTLDFWNVQPTTSILLKKTLRPAKPLRGVSGESHVSWSMTWQKDLHAQCPCHSNPCPNGIWQWTITSSSSFARIWYAGTNFHWNLASGLQVQKMCATNRAFALANITSGTKWTNGSTNCK